MLSSCIGKLYGIRKLIPLRVNQILVNVMCCQHMIIVSIYGRFYQDKTRATARLKSCKFWKSLPKDMTIYSDTEDDDFVKL
jgi:hypothetical protein